MFMRAGFNPRCRRRLCFALIIYRGRMYRAEMVRFQCGDLAWYVRGFFIWGEFAEPTSRIRVDGLPLEREYSSLRSAPTGALPSG
jgi:hypothetical protein